MDVKDSAGIGLVIGAALGLLFGTMFNQIVLGIGVGAALGLVFGYAITDKKKK